LPGWGSVGKEAEQAAERIRAWKAEE
jgi:hypothetical protein